MTTKQRLIKRINKAFGFELTDATPCFHHQGRRWGSGGFSWVFAYQGIDIGCSESMTECLKWERWVFSKSLCEIFEYHKIFIILILIVTSVPCFMSLARFLHRE